MMGKLIVGGAVIVILFILFVIFCNIDGSKCFGKAENSSQPTK
jgi:hypothetical protein